MTMNTSTHIHRRVHSPIIQEAVSRRIHKRDIHNIIMTVYLSLSELSMVRREFNDIFKQRHVASNGMNTISKQNARENDIRNQEECHWLTFVRKN